MSAGVATESVKETLECRDCGKALEKRNTSGFCRVHSAAHKMGDPRQRAKMARSRRMMFLADPEKREAAAERMRQVRELPQSRARRGENLRGGELARLSNALRPAGTKSRIIAGHRVSATKLAWCPPHLRPLYRELTQEKRLKAAEARALIEEQEAAEMVRFRRQHLERGVFVL